MSVSGSSDNWVDLLEQMLPEMIRLVVDTWLMLPKPFVDDKEDRITETLCHALRRNRTARDMPFFIEFQMVELNPAPEQELGKLDIAFRPSGLAGAPSEAIYFCLECKRLNVVKNGTKRPGGSDYVVHGMVRFVSGQYASAVRHGGMLGYVLDGDISGAIANVESNVQSHYVVLGMDAPGALHQSSIATASPTTRETLHHRIHGPTPFRVHHLFMDAQASS